MEPLVKELLERHKKERDLTGQKVQQEVKRLPTKTSQTNCLKSATEFTQAAMMAVLCSD